MTGSGLHAEARRCYRRVKVRAALWASAHHQKCPGGTEHLAYTRGGAWAPHQLTKHGAFNMQKQTGHHSETCPHARQPLRCSSPSVLCINSDRYRGTCVHAYSLLMIRRCCCCSREAETPVVKIRPWRASRSVSYTGPPQVLRCTRVREIQPRRIAQGPSAFADATLSSVRVSTRRRRG